MHANIDPSQFPQWQKSQPQLSQAPRTSLLPRLVQDCPDVLHAFRQRSVEVLARHVADQLLSDQLAIVK
eukprot:4871914-Amphidinium_carterae.1